MMRLFRVSSEVRGEWRATLGQVEQQGNPSEEIGSLREQLQQGRVFPQHSKPTPTPHTNPDAQTLRGLP